MFQREDENEDDETDETHELTLVEWCVLVSIVVILIGTLLNAMFHLGG